jgi:hypothetical protein
MEAFIEGLRAHYPEVSVRPGSGGAQLVRVSRVSLPGHRHQQLTDVLVVLQPGFRSAGGRPAVYVAPGTHLTNGAAGRNVTPVSVEGESWLQFSFNFAWRPEDEPWKLVEGALRRFLKDE